MRAAAVVSMRSCWAALCLAAVVLVQGCAHPIALNPDLAKVKTGSPTKLERKVGLYIGDEDRKREVVSPAAEA